MAERYTTALWIDKRGAAALIAVILLMTLVLIFMLTISWQVLVNVKNAKLMADFNELRYAVESGVRDARIQLKKETDPAKVFSDITVGDMVVTRKAVQGPYAVDFFATGTAAFIHRILTSRCDVTMANCTPQEEVLP